SFSPGLSSISLSHCVRATWWCSITSPVTRSKELSMRSRRRGPKFVTIDGGQRHALLHDTLLRGGAHSLIQQELHAAEDQQPGGRFLKGAEVRDLFQVDSRCQRWSVFE